MPAVLTPGLVGEEVARSKSAPPIARRGARALRGALSAALSIAFLGAAWWFLAPPPLGGSTSFVTVDGTSMLPNLHRSELVALRPASAYRVGDVVGYRSPLLHRVVLHRIVAIHGAHYVLKGDNNTFLDPDRPTRSHVVGKLWFHVPSAGRAVQLLHIPWIVGALAVLLVLALGLGRSGPRHDEREPDRL